MAFYNNVIAGASNPTGGGGGTGFTIQRSLRFNSSEDSSLSKSFGTAGNRKKFTWSGWVKRATASTECSLFTAGSSTENSIRFNANGTLKINACEGSVETTAVFRDCSAWYHILVNVNSELSTAADRIKLFVNGKAVALSGTNATTNGIEKFNKAEVHYIGRQVHNTSNDFDGLLAEIHFLDGANATTATDSDGSVTGTAGTEYLTQFGEFDANTFVWNPIAFTGSYGPYGGVALASANGALPILNTSGGHGLTVTSGVRSDSLSANIVLALPLNGSNSGTTITDYHHTVKGSGSAKAITLYTGSASGGAVTSTAQSRYYGSSFYVVRGATNNYSASDYISRTGDSDLAVGTGSFCVEFWYKPGTFVQNSCMFDSRHNSTDWPNATHGFQFYTNHNGDLILRTGSSNVISASSKLTSGQWHHLAVAGDYSGGNRTIRIYCDGTLAGSVTNNNNFSEGRFVLGSAANNGEGSNGYYADLRIYKGVPKYTANFTVPELGTGGDNSFALGFNDISSNSSLGTDSSGKNNTWSVSNLSSGGPQVSTSAITNVATSTNTNRTISVTAAGWQSLNNAVDSSDSSVSPSNNNTPGTITFSPALVGVTKVRAKTRFYGSGTAKLYNGSTELHAVSHNNNNATQYYDIYDGAPIELTQYWQQMNSSAASDDFWALEVNGVIVATNTNGGNLSSTIPGSQHTLTTTDTTNFSSFATSDTVNQNGIVVSKNTSTPSLTISGGSWSNGDKIDRIPGSDCDSFIDTPTNYTSSQGNAGGNYATLNILDRQQSNGTLSNGNLGITSTGSNWAMYRSTIFVNSGKWYWEVEIGNDQYTSIGIIDDEYSMGEYTNAWFNQTTNMFGYYPYNGKKYNGGSGVNYATGDTTATGSIIGVALDMENGTLTFYKDGTSLGQAYSGLTGKSFSPAHWIYAVTNADIYNFGQRPFFYAPGKTGGPASDFKAICSTNFDDTTIQKGLDHFVVSTWSGNSNQDHKISTSFSPGVVWAKRRNGAKNHLFFDRIRGDDNYLHPNTTNGNQVQADLLGFASDGYELGTVESINLSGNTYVGWAWYAGAVTNPVGDIWRAGSTKYIGIKFASASGGTVSYGATAGSTTVEVWTSSDNSNWTQQGGTLTLSSGHTLTTSDQYVYIRNSSNATFTDWYVAATNGADGHYSSVTYPSGASWSGPGYTDYDWRQPGAALNKDGSTLSIVQANPTAGFSIVHVPSVDSTNTLRTTGTGLTAAPEFIISKNLDFTDNWFVYHKDIQTNDKQYLILNNGSGTTSSGSTIWGRTSTTMSFNGALWVGSGNTDDLTFNCWHSVEGFSKIGSFQPKGMSDNEFVWTGFRPKFIFFKYSSSNGDWMMLDTSRRPNGPTGGTLVAQEDKAEDDWYAASQANIDFLSNGFKIRHHGSPGGDSGRTVVYACWAENPFKISRAY